MTMRSRKISDLNQMIAFKMGFADKDNPRSTMWQDFLWRFGYNPKSVKDARLDKDGDGHEVGIIEWDDTPIDPVEDQWGSTPPVGRPGTYDGE